MSKHRWTVGFDADDTLWQNERFFHLTQARFAELLADYAAPEHLEQRLVAAEMRNVGHYGFGVKGFVLSMIETAIEVTDQKVPASVIAELIAAGQEMLRYEIELMPHAREAVEALAPRADLVLITKGDLIDQERKLAQSGLGEMFGTVEIVSQKTRDTYTRIFAKADTPRAMMVGNSLKSDVIPAIEAGAWGVHVPTYPVWHLEQADPPRGNPRFHEIPDLSHLPALFESLD
ncbi:HAD family hydrolase [Pseudoroseicyclus aestuarii]|uniref:Putative hydrolase of the HAD superfamily n=1 Tax=Pseudoroseicyclus aestuarii TaxID=1795041 RepID=A0A318SXD5_9RHOB|nr:HAD family hydrolase [Pseudoroseicyclus aestuarii]PYE85009.1 putative hydrolase of the HAD superfamily [Pseudoroseicyclus aestuarii]